LDFSATQLGAVGALLLVVWKLLDVAKALFLSRREQSQPELGHQHQRHDDPVHELQMEDVHKRVMGGHVGCHWKDREEVRDFIEAMRAQTAASKQQTAAINALVEEMRRARVAGGVAR